ncbi:hypothetical protein ACO2Q0_13405 [Phenylobacterium sp. VNQ135]|uniref:hypothetical protein n=1 Tax=Phenylobacterium sp. VNQ135 TaxID=3400922 RepID=UPI003C0A7673
MPLYTFHPCRADGTSDTFVTVDLRGDHEIEAYARGLLAQHSSCACVEVWQEEREIAEFRRSEFAVG